VQGLSGLVHPFDAMGRRGKNILLVVGGADRDHPADRHPDSPRTRMMSWRDRALLSAYDVQAALQSEGFVVDLLFFHNISYGPVPIPQGAFSEWVQEHRLPADVRLSHSVSVNEIPKMSNDELRTVAQSIGACFLSLNDFLFSDISLLTTPCQVAEQKNVLANLLRAHRVVQYFHPPMDELILGAYGFSKRQDVQLLERLPEAAMSVGHPVAPNVLVKQANYLDPVETAKALENHKYISYSSKLEITDAGTKIIHEIHKSAQGSLIVRILKHLGLSELAKLVIQTIMRCPPD